jgi:hypothetical protein
MYTETEYDIEMWITLIRMDNLKSIGVCLDLNATKVLPTTHIFFPS